jgi:hypothetical protein
LLQSKSEADMAAGKRLKEIAATVINFNERVEGTISKGDF